MFRLNESYLIEKLNKNSGIQYEVKFFSFKNGIEIKKEFNNLTDLSSLELIEYSLIEHDSLERKKIRVKSIDSDNKNN